MPLGLAKPFKAQEEGFRDIAWQNLQSLLIENQKY